MRHPIALAALATSATVLVAALRDARPALFFFFAFGIVCFALASVVRDYALPVASGPLFCTVAGVVQLVAFSARPMRKTRHLVYWRLWDSVTFC